MRSAQFEVLPQQADFIDCEQLFSAAYGGVGSGKTFGAQWRMWKRLRRYPKAGHYVVGADFEQLRGGYFLDFRNLLEDLLNWKEGRDFTYRDSPRPSIILLDTGARIRALSAELAERIRSTQIQSLHGEEPQTWKNGAGEQVWRTLVGRMRHSIRSAGAYPDMPIQAWLTFNPIGAPVGSWLHTLIEKNWAAAGYPAWRFSLRDNYLLPDVAQYIANLEANLPQNVWPVEIDGFWPTSGGDVYGNFDDAVNGSDPAALGLPPMALHPSRLLWTLDFNVTLQCSVVAQAHVQQPIAEYKDGRQTTRMPVPQAQRRVFYAIGEIALERSGAEDVVKFFLAHPQWGPHAKQYGVTLYGDATGGAQSSLVSSENAITSNWLAIYHGLRNAGVSVKWRVQSRNPNPWERVNAVNAQFRTGGGTGGYSPGRNGYGAFIDTLACPELTTDFRQVKKAVGKNDIDKSDKSAEGLRRTHASDAWGYLVWVERKLEKDGPSSIKWSVIR